MFWDSGPLFIHIVFVNSCLHSCSSTDFFWGSVISFFCWKLIKKSDIYIYLYLAAWECITSQIKCCFYCLIISKSVSIHTQIELTMANNILGIVELKLDLWHFLLKFTGVDIIVQRGFHFKHIINSRLVGTWVNHSNLWVQTPLSPNPSNEYLFWLIYLLIWKWRDVSERIFKNLP